MQKANAVGGLLSILVGVLWLLVGVAGLSFWVAVVASMLVGGYWAFGRQLVAGGGQAEVGGRNRNRNRNRR